MKVFRSLYLLLSACSKRRLYAPSIVLFYQLPATRFYKCPETSPCSLYSEYTSTKSRNKNKTRLVFLLQLQKMTVYLLGEEKDRNNRITNENNALNSRIKNYQEELLEREKDIERLRESRKKMEVELEHEKANTKVCHMT